MRATTFCRLFLIAAAVLILTACASRPGMRIGNAVTLCCPGNYESYTTYAVEDVGLPLFLRDYVVKEFDAAFSERGLTRNDERSDLVATLRYVHVNLDPDTEDVDPFVRMESINTELRYIATIDIAIRERAGGRKIWGGQISRIHSVSPGEYMHEQAASPAFLQTFRDLFSYYPGRFQE